MAASVRHSSWMPLKVMLSGLANRHRYKLAVTYLLILGQNICQIIFPIAIGMTIDGLLTGQWYSLFYLIAVWSAKLTIVLARYLYDTRSFTSIYAELAANTVERQRASGVVGHKIVARVTLARELINFFEYEIPALMSFFTLFLGSIFMLFWFDSILGLYAITALIPVLIISVWLARRSYRLNKSLNNRLEREVEIVGSRPLSDVKRHYHRARLWRIGISNIQAGAWGMIDVVVLSLAVVTLYRTTSAANVTPGEIYAVLAYVWQYNAGASDLPNIVENVSRMKDIGERLAKD